jgi:hypothetical protein
LIFLVNDVVLDAIMQLDARPAQFIRPACLWKFRRVRQQLRTK